MHEHIQVDTNLITDLISSMQNERRILRVYIFSFPLSFLRFAFSIPVHASFSFLSFGLNFCIELSLLSCSIFFSRSISLFLSCSWSISPSVLLYHFRYHFLCLYCSIWSTFCRKLSVAFCLGLDAFSYCLCLSHFLILLITNLINDWVNCFQKCWIDRTLFSLALFAVFCFDPSVSVDPSLLLSLSIILLLHYFISSSFTGY